ncbi:NepR family anti-sigma factor [Jannaschia sp. W003]|uniref:NepR family anti-sigma factor n=1 Tax=Jannaschia sp. W003 TaxID=2867012 RepID=UPI0021A4705F|nr:NepR family anti-sigma factor [Jannaschia sp. W003]UWQ22456.1 hypothetical protein K3554_05355 [Jannaschia sp. W003]
MARSDEKTNIDSLIDANLRRVYETVLNEDVPDRFSALLSQLRSGQDDQSADAPADQPED